MKYNLATIKRIDNKELREEMISRYLVKKSKKFRPFTDIPSLQDDWHRIYNEQGDSWQEFGFFEPGDMTDEEIDEWVEGMREYVHSPYDCSGEVFTLWLHWYRNPCGWISVIHGKGIDC